MAILDYSKFTLYRWRYKIGYSIIGLMLVGLIGFAGRYIPGGLSVGEQASVVTSYSIDYTNLSSLVTLDLPYHLLQDGILHLFGADTFTIKLASLLIATLSAVGLIALLQRWFRPNIAVLASLIAVSTGQFLFIGQLGTPDIMLVFWPIALLLLGTQITREAPRSLLWKILFALAVGLSLYTPLSIYVLIAIALTVSLHPHLRAIMRRLRPKKISLSLAALVVPLVPLVLALIESPQLGLRLLGMPEDGVVNIIENAQLFATQFFVFWQPDTTTVMTPVFGLGAFLLIVLGFYRLIRTIDTTRSYLIVSWLACLTLPLLVSPSLVAINFVPSVLLLAAGLASLIGYWYRLFPLNPYARIAGLLPIIILVGALVSSGITRYFYGYTYTPEAVRTFSEDLRILPADTAHVVADDAEVAFYEAVGGYNDSYSASTQPEGDTITITRAAHNGAPDGYSITRIITNQWASDADRFYVYTKRD